MISDHILLLAAIIGHGLILILLLNVTHGFGINLRWIDTLVLGLLAGAGVASLGVGIWLWNRSFAQWPEVLRLYAILCIAMLLLGLPLATLKRGLRRTLPEARKVREEITDLIDSSPIEHFLGTSRHASLLRLPGNESFQIHHVGYEIELPDAPALLEGLDILHLTDLHFSHAFSRLYFETVIGLAAQGPEPDLVMITGDFVDDNDTAAWIEPVLSRLSARLGKFAILGNHDYRHPVRPTRRALKAAGFRVLEGKWSNIQFRGARIAIGGTSAPWGRSLDPGSVPEAAFRLVMSHSPDQIFRASRMGVDLMLAGHVHGGQVRLPGIGPVLMPSRFSRHFDRGFFRKGPTLLFVGQGISGKHPIRWGCPPEIARLVVRVRKDVSTGHHARRFESQSHS